MRRSRVKSVGKESNRHRHISFTSRPQSATILWHVILDPEGWSLP
jgi:hypothetical protein